MNNKSDVACCDIYRNFKIYRNNYGYHVYFSKHGRDRREFASLNEAIEAIDEFLFEQCKDDSYSMATSIVDH